MCDPATLAVTAAVMTAAAGATTAYSQYQAGKYQGKVAENNAVIQERLAQDALDRGAIQEQRHRQNVAQFRSQQRATMGAAGIELGSGSAADILADTSMMGELDALTIRSNAEREAWGRRVGAQNYRAQGRLARASGRNQAIGTILSTGGQVAGGWYQMGGTFPGTRGPSPVGTNNGGA